MDTRKHLICAAAVVTLAVALAEPGQPNGPESAAVPAGKKAPDAQAAQTAAPPAASRPIVLGQAATAKWTATTYEAATAEAHKKVLEGGKVATVTGEVVDVSCYLQLGKRGEAHIACGSKCIANGQPIGLLEDDGDLYLLMAEEHHPRRDGQVDLKAVFGPLLAKTVTATGVMTEARGYKALFVQAAELGGTVKPEPSAPKGEAQKSGTPK